MKVTAVLTLCAGLLSTAFGLYAFAIMAYVLLVQERLEHVSEMMAGCFLYLGTGIALFVAGNLFWRSKIKAAVTTTLVAVLIPVVLFAINGF